MNILQDLSSTLSSLDSKLKVKVSLKAFVLATFDLWSTETQEQIKSLDGPQKVKSKGLIEDCPMFHLEMFNVETTGTT